MNELQFRLERRFRALGLSDREAGHLVDEVLDLFDQTVDEFVLSRHRELRREGHTSEAIYRRIQDDLEDWRFRAPVLTTRQIRRRIHG